MYIRNDVNRWTPLSEKPRSATDYLDMHALATDLLHLQTQHTREQQCQRKLISPPYNIQSCPILICKPENFLLREGKTYKGY